jgi:hypothetical protein
MEWISVRDRMPKERTGVLGYCTSDDEDMTWTGIVHVYYSVYTGWHRCELQDKRTVFITHWIPLPASPNGK